MSDGRDEQEPGADIACLEINGTEVYVLSLSIEPNLPDDLSDSEREVILMVLAGASNAEIAEVRGTAVQTVANQLHTAFKKIGVSSRGDLAALLYEDALDSD